MGEIEGIGSDGWRVADDGAVMGNCENGNNDNTQCNSTTARNCNSNNVSQSPAGVIHNKKQDRNVRLT